MWLAAGGIVVILAVIWAAYAVGKSHGKTDQQKREAEGRAEDMAHDAEISARPPVDRPLSGMQPKN